MATYSSISRDSNILKNDGITLIALIITIIVMLILVSVSITTVIRGGLFQKAGEGVRDTDNAVAAENEIGSGKVTIGGTEYNSLANYANTIASGGETSLPTITAGTRATAKSTYSIGGQTATIPVRFTVSGIANEQSIDNGLVIYSIPE